MSYSYRIEQAIRAASVLHKGQVRKGDTPFPYITHLYAVAMLVSDYTDDEDIIVAALLHDTLEDTDYTPEELQDDFGGIVKDIVLGVTQPEPDAEGKEAWKNAKKQYIKQLKNAPEGSLMVSAADKIHNMRCIVEDFYDKPSEFTASFGGSINDRLLQYQEISNVLNRRLNNGILDEFNHVFTEYRNFLEYVEQRNSEF
jgi:(p)ppGpp synthase/HD superfamily hydrolase